MKTSLRSPLLALGLAWVGITTTQAAPVTLQNPSFEADELADGGSTSTITGWVKSTSGNSSATYNPLLIDTQPVTGQNVYLGTTSLGNGRTLGQFIYQQDLIQVQANTTYTLSLNVAGRAFSPLNFGYGGYVAQIGVGDLTSGTNFRTLAVSNGPGTRATNKAFEFITFSFTTPNDLTSTTVRNGSEFDNTAATTQADITGQYLRIGVGMPQPTTVGFADDTQTLIDDVSFDATAVPEPSAWALLGVSMIGGLVMFRRRRKLAA